MLRLWLKQAPLCLLLAAPLAQSTDAEQAQAIAKRIRPVGEVCIAGQPCIATTIETPAEPETPSRSGEQLTAQFCAVCHASGLMNAPRIGSETWSLRAQQLGGLDGLLNNAIQGIGAMPARGACAACSDEELRAAIRYMSGL